MGIFGNPAGAFVQGAETGMNRQNKQELLKMQKAQHEMTTRTQENANYEMDLLRNALEEEKANNARWKKANLTVNRDRSINAYIGSLRPDAFSNSDEFGGDISQIQDFSRIASPDKKPPQIPNMADDNQVRQIVNILKDEMGDQVEGVSETDLWDAAIKLGMSGEYIAVGETSDTIVPIQKVYGALGAQMNKEAQTKFNSFAKMKNKLLLASKGKLSGDGGAEDSNIKLYSQIQADKKLRDEIIEAGGTVPVQLTNRIAVNENLYNKENLGASAAETARKNREEYTQAQKLESAGKLYKGGAEDVKHFNTLQIKDKEKKFADVQKEVESFRTFKHTSDRINNILSQADIDRDAISNLGFKIKQYLGDTASEWVDKLSGKGVSSQSVKELLKDKKAMAAFNRIETAVGFPMVMLIKEISGAAVTNEEREYLMNLVIGGEFKNMDALTEKMDEFINTLGDRAKKSLNKRITGGKALRPNWGNMVEAEIDKAMTKGIVGSTLDLTSSSEPQTSQETVSPPSVTSQSVSKLQQMKEQIKGMRW